MSSLFEARLLHLYLLLFMLSATEFIHCGINNKGTRLKWIWNWTAVHDIESYPVYFSNVRHEFLVSTTVSVRRADSFPTGSREFIHRQSDIKAFIASTMCKKHLNRYQHIYLDSVLFVLSHIWAQLDLQGYSIMSPLCFNVCVVLRLCIAF